MLNCIPNYRTWLQREVTSAGHDDRPDKAEVRGVHSSRRQNLISCFHHSHLYIYISFFLSILHLLDSENKWGEEQTCLRLILQPGKEMKKRYSCRIPHEAGVCRDHRHPYPTNPLPHPRSAPDLGKQVEVQCRRCARRLEMLMTCQCLSRCMFTAATAPVRMLLVHHPASRPRRKRVGLRLASFISILCS